MKLPIRVALLALVLTPVIAASANDPRVVLATPGIGGGAIERFTLRFNEAMVPLGDPRAQAPATVECPVAGTGRWADQQTYVHEFASGLPGGVSCTFKLRDKLKSLAGYEVNGSREFKVDSGGPIARAVLPAQYDGEIEEDQIFLVASNMAADRASVASNAYCAVNGIGERIPVDVLPASAALEILGGLGNDNWTARNFYNNAGMAETLPAEPDQRATALQNVTALKCRRALPPGREMALVWGGGISGAGGRTAGTDQRFDFTVRKPFAARFECSRINPQAGCNPMQPAYVRFSAPIARETAEAVRIEIGGRSVAPTLTAEEKRQGTLSDLKFVAPFPAATPGKVVLPAGVKDESGRVLSNAERFPLDMRFDEAPPLIKFASGFGILEAREGGVLPVTVRNVEPQLQGRNLNVVGQSLRVDGSDAAIANWLRRIDAADEYKVDEVQRGTETVRINQTGARPILPANSGPQFTVNLPGRGKEFEVVGIPLQRPGFYVVEMASPALGAALLGRNAPRYVAVGALVTNMAVHFKWGRADSMAWVTSLDSGQPVGGADVRVTDSCTGRLLARGTTDAQGRLTFNQGLPQPQTYSDCADNSATAAHALMISARKADDFSFTLTDWSDGIRPTDFELPYAWQPAEEVFHTVFDRALLKQGETIHMKHLLRRPVATGLALAPGFSGTLRLSHRGSDTRFDLPLTIDAAGTGETIWTAPAGAPMGDYDVQVVRGDQTIYTSQSFKVDEYRLPTMRATVTGPREAAIKPATLPLDLFVGYLSGGGAPNLPVEVRIGYFDGIGKPAGYDQYSFGGRPVEEGIKPLNGDNEEEGPQLPPTQTLPLTLGADGTQRAAVEVPRTLEGNTAMRVEMDYQDANGEVLTASRRIPIYASGVQLGVRTDGWLMKQDDLRLKFVALDTAGKPIKGQRVSVALYSREILTARRRLIGGFYAYDNKMKTTRLAGTCTATTDDLGLAACQIDPGIAGEVLAVATAQDSAGNVARAVTSVWLAGDDDWWFGGDNGDRMDVVAERNEYKSGETARFQVRMPFREATALVTVEREGVLQSFVTQLSGQNPVVEVKMDGAYAPDVYVSVMAVRGRVSGWSLWLSNLSREWGLPFFNREGARPTATVDLAKPSYRLGVARVRVGWDARRLNVAVKADRERYPVRGQAAVAVQVRNPDGTPAASADVAFAAVDEALLQLAPNESWDVLDAMMGERPLGVVTSTAQMQVVGKRHYGRKAVEAGGGGGEGDLSGLNRENFQPVLLWRGKVPLDANGQARVTVPLSDSLSAFRMVAIASNGAQLFGTGSATVRTAQDLSIFSGVAPLVRTGDFIAQTFTLRNGSDKPMRVTATVDVSPRIASGRPLTVEIPAGGAAPVAWNLAIPEGVDRLAWRVTARAEGSATTTDQITVTQEVAPAVPLETWAGALTRVGPATSITVTPPAGALPGRGQVLVSLSDTLAPPLDGVRDYMARYPYTCFEQRLSKAVATGDVAQWNVLAAEMPAYLDGDGLLRYFPNDRVPGSETLTAYVLALTAEAGLPVPEGPRGRMIEALKAVIDGRLRRDDYGDVRFQKVAAFSALARAGAATGAMLGQLGITPGDMPTSLLGDYLAALPRTPGLANGAQLRAAAEGVLRQRLVYEGTRLDLTDGGNAPWWLMRSTDESAIKALLAVLGRPGWDVDAPKMMVGVAMRQQRGHWDTTPANAWGALAARRFNTVYPAQAITGSTTVALPSQSLSRAWPLAVEQRNLSFALPAAPAPLRLTQAGGAGPWATVRVTAAVPLTQPLSAGYRLERKVEVVQRKSPDTLTRGDVVRVTLTVEASAERNWVVISDPIPAGATVLGGLGGQSEMLNQPGANDNGAPSYVERGRDAWRAYFRWVPRGRTTVTYTMRLNGAGRLNLPPSRVEAMYSPEIRAAVPNQPLVVAQR